MSDQILGEVTGQSGYDGLATILRMWIADLGTTYEAIDELALQPARNTSKLLGPPRGRGRRRGLGQVSMGPILAALGLKLAVMVDAEQLAKVRHRLTPSRWTEARRATERRKLMEDAHACLEKSGKHRCAGDSEWGKRAQAAKMLKTSPEARQRQASIAANARWKAARRRIAAAEANHAWR
jgi:hypothetical protein